MLVLWGTHRHTVEAAVMRSYVATTYGKRYEGGWLDCLNWATEQANTDALIKVHRARPESKDMRVVAEVSYAGIRAISGGRVVRR